MKKFTKNCLIIAGGLCAIGLILVILCSALGGKELFQKALEDNTFNVGNIGYHVRAIPFGDSDWHSQDGDDWDIDWSDDWDSDDTADTHDFFNSTEKTAVASASDIDDIKLQIGAAKMEISTSEDDQYWFQCSGNRVMKCYVEDGTLVIRGVNKDDNNHDTIYLSVPDGVCLDAVTIELGAGHIQVDGLQSEELKASIGAGQITFNNTQTTDVKIEVGAGNAEYNGIVSGDMKVECAMGHVKMHVIGDQKDWNYSVECVAGQIRVGDAAYNNLVSDQKIDNEADHECKLECAMGHVEVAFQPEA